MKKKAFLCFAIILILNVATKLNAQSLQINEHEYFEKHGLNVMVFFDIYPEGHQGAVGIIQNGTRVATNGDLRLEPTPGQWQPIPKVGKRSADRTKNEISVKCTYPDSSINRKGFNPVEYPDL
ncbi:MAG: glycoside hydrolase, partial [Bacteroidota bacterium]|nr:glycoside hydrolase [Bacteroidota bacterium]